ncbi:hypothetical protein DICA1_D05732 [Diutina catenulata]
MKFGSNIDSLSIPEWRAYNIDYNAIKSEIRAATEHPTHSLDRLSAVITDNFDYVTLFLATKYGELERKLLYLYQLYQTTLREYDDDDAPNQRKFHLKLDAILYQVITLSHTLNQLSKYNAIQKLATKKMFKKFYKYYPNKRRAQQFVAQMKGAAMRDPNSFIHADLAPLIYKVTNFICELRGHQRTRSARRGSSIFTIDFSGVHPQQMPPSQDCSFDLAVLLKKNFSIDFLVPDDAVSDLVLNMNVYLNCQPTSPESEPRRTAFTYLFDRAADEPSYIISQEGEDYSTMVTYTGGLRKYSYSILPNTIIQKLLDYLTGPDEGNAKSELYQYFVETKISPLTRNTIDTMLSHNLLPKFKLVCTRQRYILSNEQPPGDDDDLDFDEAISIASWSNYQDDYLLNLDCDIHTTNDPSQVNTLAFAPMDDRWDRFPHNHLSVDTNDSNLSTFDHSLTTEVKDSVVVSRYSEPALRRLPGPLQNLVENTSLSLFKRLSFHAYMQSCYLNVVPRKELAVNHYSHVLGLNLHKKIENVSSFTNQLRSESSIIKARSDRIIKRQISLGNLRDTDSATAAAVLRNDSISMSRASSQSLFEQPVEDDGYLTSSTDELVAPESDYVSLMRTQAASDPSLLNQAVIKMLGWQHAWSDDAQAKPYEFSPLVPAYLEYYNAVDEEEAFLSRSHCISQFERNYDQVLSSLYFAGAFMAVFVSAIECGIVYSVFELSSELVLGDLMWVVVVVVLGMISSLIMSLVAIQLNLQRFQPAPTLHSYVVWISLTVVSNCCIWSSVMLARHI